MECEQAKDESRDTRAQIGLGREAHDHGERWRALNYHTTYNMKCRLIFSGAESRSASLIGKG